MEFQQNAWLDRTLPQVPIYHCIQVGTSGIEYDIRQQRQLVDPTWHSVSLNHSIEVVTSWPWHWVVWLALNIQRKQIIIKLHRIINLIKLHIKIIKHLHVIVLLLIVELCFGFEMIYKIYLFLKVTNDHDLVLSLFSEIRVAQSLLFCILFCIPCCPFVYFVLSIVLSVLRFTDSDYPFGIFKFSS